MITKKISVSNQYKLGQTFYKLEHLHECSKQLTFVIQGGFGFKFVDRQICLIVFTIVMGLTLGVLPILKSLPLFFIVGSLNVSKN